TTLPRAGAPVVHDSPGPAAPPFRGAATHRAPDPPHPTSRADGHRSPAAGATDLPVAGKAGRRHQTGDHGLRAASPPQPGARPGVYPSGGGIPEGRRLSP